MRFGNDADERDAQDVANVLYGQHFAFVDAFGRIAGNQQVFFDRTALFRFAGFALQDTQDAVGITDAGYFGVGSNDGFVGEVERHQCALFDTGWRVADDVFESHLVAAQFLHDFFDAFTGQRVFVAGLRCRQNEEVFAVFVFNQCLGERGFALDDVNQIIHNASFATHNQIEVTQTDVKVDNGGFVAAQCQSGCNTGAGRGFTYAAFT